AGADEELQRTAFLTSLSGDRFGGFALQSGEFAAQDGLGMLPLFVTVKQRQVAGEEAGQLARASAHVRGRDIGLLQQGLGFGVFQDAGHKNTPSGLPEGYASQSPR